MVATRPEMTQDELIRQQALLQEQINRDYQLEVERRKAFERSKKEQGEARQALVYEHTQIALEREHKRKLEAAAKAHALACGGCSVPGSARELKRFQDVDYCFDCYIERMEEARKETE